MSTDPESVDSHFDPVEMEMFGLDAQNPDHRAEWVKTEPKTGDNPNMVSQLLALYAERHPVPETPTQQDQSTLS